MTNQVAQTILQQLGGNKFLAMTGASNLTCGNRTLCFKIGRNSKKITHVQITLTAMDDYIVEFLNIRGTLAPKPIAYAECQAEMLAKVFADKTGMAVSL